MKKILSIVVWTVLSFACSTSQKSAKEKTDTPTAVESADRKNQIQVPFEEFSKILQPRGIVVLEGKNALLLILALPGDKHPCLYRYEISSKKLTKEYDHGQSISGLQQDRVGKNIYLLIDNKGDENFGVYTYNNDKKSVAPFFVRHGYRSTIIDSDRLGKYVFIKSNFENKAIYSIYKMEIGTDKLERISDGLLNISDAIVSPSGKKLILSRNQSNNENILYLLDVESKKTSELFKNKNSTFAPQFFTEDESKILGDSDFNRDRIGCAEINLSRANRVRYVLKEASKDVSCEFGEWSGVYLVGKAARGKSTLQIYKNRFSGEIKVPTLFPNQSVSPISFDRVTGEFYLQYSAANTPGVIVKFNPKSTAYEMVMEYNVSSIKREEMAISYDFDFKSFDGLPIHSILHAKPEWLKSKKKFPLIIWPHGGPDSLETHNYRGVFQFLSLNGFVVIAPNFRGSRGYGKRFETLNDRDWGGGHIRDLVVAKNKALKKYPFLDANRVFILGGSFGGYSTLATITFQPTEFKAAVAIVAIGNLFTFMKSIPPDEGWQAEFRREVGDPIKDKKLYEERSPFFHVEQIRVPLQIYQAENDVRTVKAEMDQFVQELKNKNKAVDYTVLRNVGHGLETPESRKLIYEGAVKFFQSFNERL